MRNDVWDSTGDVTEVSGRLEIDGAEVSASGLSVSRSIPSNLPAQVAGVGGYTAATGSATVSPALRVTDKSPTPWGPDTPQPLAPVKAYAVSGANKVPVFSGLVDSTKGSASESDTDVSLVDISDRLSRAVTLPPMCRIMPAPTTSGSTNELNSDLFSTHLVDGVLRQCDFYATPPMMGYCVMSAPLMGSAWPERGRLMYAGRGASHTESPRWGTAPWGVCATQLRADYEPDDRFDYAGARTLTRPMEIVLMNGGTQNTSCRISTEWPNGAEVSVSVTSSGSVLVQIMFPSNPERQTSITATRDVLGYWRTVRVRFIPTGDSKMRIELVTNNKGSATKTGVSIPYGAEHMLMSNIRVDLPDNYIGGVQVGFPGSASGSESAPRTAVLTPPVPFVPLVGSPAIVNEPAIDLLKEWAEAECAAMWIDEDGVFQWRNRTRFTSGSAVADLTSSRDLLDLSWSHDVQGAAARSVVKHKTFGVQRTKRSRIQVWQGSGQTMEPGDVFEEFATCPDDEIWINVDGTPDVFKSPTSKTAFNRGEGSWVGYVGYDAKGDEHGNTEYVGYSGTIEFVSRKTWKIVQSWLGNAPAGLTEIKTQTRDGGTVLKPQWQGVNLPILRAQCRMTMADAQQVGSAGGPKDAPDLEHDVGWWVQDAEAIRSLAYWLAQQTTKPLPIVDGVEVMPDPRLQLGDKVNVSDTHRTGLRITGVITEIQQGIKAGDHSMSLRLLVTDVMATHPTLFDYDAVFSGASLSTRDEIWGTGTLGEFDSNPLKR